MILRTKSTAEATNLPPAVLKAIEPAGLPRPAPEWQEAVGPGAYLLILDVRSDVRLPITRLKEPLLEAGFYIYAGSARGPGGIAARVGRHMRADKRPHWHIDPLALHASARHALAYPGAGECGLAQALLSTGAFVCPVSGFGASDCRRCDSHLLRLTRR
jgi:Uri superfamily endonuclease